MLRSVLAILGGLVAAFAIVFLSDALFHALVPSAATSVDPNDGDAMAAYVASQPAGVLAGLVAGWALAALVGSWIAARFSGRGAWPGLVVGGLFLCATAANFVMVTHPLWMVVLGIGAIMIAAWFGAQSGARAPLRPAT